MKWAMRLIAAPFLILTGTVLAILSWDALDSFVYWIEERRRGRVAG